MSELHREDLSRYGEETCQEEITPIETEPRKIYRARRPIRTNESHSNFKLNCQLVSEVQENQLLKNETRIEKKASKISNEEVRDTSPKKLPELFSMKLCHIAKAADQIKHKQDSQVLEDFLMKKNNNDENKTVIGFRVVALCQINEEMPRNSIFRIIRSQYNMRNFACIEIKECESGSRYQGMITSKSTVEVDKIQGTVSIQVLRKLGNLERDTIIVELSELQQMGFLASLADARRHVFKSCYNS